MFKNRYIRCATKTLILERIIIRLNIRLSTWQSYWIRCYRKIVVISFFGTIIFAVDNY
jgi:hypothetical protein